MSLSSDETSVVVAIDFGTTFSGFAFANKVKPEDKKWGEQALVYEPSKKARETEIHYIVERFKLFLDDEAICAELPKLPRNMDAKRFIADYLGKLKHVIEENLEKRCGVVPLSQVLFVMSVPAEWPPRTRDILRECAYKSGLLSEKSQQNLEFTTEPEAAAIYCLSSINEHLSVGDTFLVVDCGGGTVDLTVRTLQPDNTLEEETVRSGGLCGSTCIDREFVKFLGRMVGLRALITYKKRYYGNLQKLIYKFFCDEVKLPFTGDPETYENIELDIEKHCPDLMNLVCDEAKERLEEDEWVIDLEFEDVKKMFDPTISKIIALINAQIESLPKNKIKVMFLVGGFSESEYLYKRIKSALIHLVPKIIVPPQPIAAIVKGACYYGLNKSIIKVRALKWTYGIEVCDKYNPHHDPKELQFTDKVLRFDSLASQGERLKINEERLREYKPLRNDQLHCTLKLLFSRLSNPRYSNEKGVHTLGQIFIKFPLKSMGQERPIKLHIKFAEEELNVTARNVITNEVYHATFIYPNEI
ncbi:3589_t:CDS:2 [Funneliformis mosseae]|uniref:3589_t:CDS:1 n=1 Tax=Funneliformis mosseae TaxID=27381 RepID=A0A9N9BZK0_FUNMO|nr:3589_t:CDS:2 [Funneliformis mosseae]